MVSVLQDAGPVTIPPQRVVCPAGDNRPLLSLAHIPRNHDSETLFNKDVLVSTKSFSWLWETYGGMCEHGLVRPCRCEGANPTDIYQRAFQQNLTALLMVSTRRIL